MKLQDPRDRGHGPGAWPTDWSVDVHEPTDTPSRSERSPAVAAGVRLSPLQQVWGRYVAHSLRCLACQDVDQRCSVAAVLYREWWDLAHQAARSLRGG